ncbi:type II toxin-antitoxin system RelE/ParE family toxin [Pseudomonas citronellolis]|uniref:type II toxin-antitoxin system RelE/ParE family toxin n=1 Tax=Pseudomonas citronellolis TaxID=53408 RepID=UPI0026481ABF|nr:type II toxin-antitoxin system RelE/ParE family toxin [Pseudomonas citronellolis]MDN6875502.1 type II toxin-antitoxin system RelE/ParE family toxin [Pseudomonas citronellolis]
MAAIEVVEYVREDASCPYQEWFDSLHFQAAAKVATAKVRMAVGNTSNVGIGEYRIDWGPGYRIYLARDGEALIVLFGGGSKAGQAADIRKAKVLHAEYKQRKKARFGPQMRG